MKSKLKICVVLSIVLLIVFFVYKNHTSKKTMVDWSGTYVSYVPSLEESFFMLLKHKRQNLRFVPNEVKKMYLNVDSTYIITEVVGSGKVLSYSGTWKLVDKVPVLEVVKNEYQIKEFPFNSFVYYDEYLKRCQDTTLTTLRINVFKKID